MPNDSPNYRNVIREVCRELRNNEAVPWASPDLREVAKQIGPDKFKLLWNEVSKELEEERRKLEEERRNQLSRFAPHWVTNLKLTFYPHRSGGAITRPGHSGTSIVRGAYKMFGQLEYRKRWSQAQAHARTTSVQIPVRREMWWNTAERLARIFLWTSPMIILLGLIILYIQNQNRQYVELAVSVLKEPDDKVTPMVKSWAGNILVRSVPGISDHLLGRPSKVTDMLAWPGKTTEGAGLAISANGKFIATGHTDGSVRLWETSTGKLYSEFRDHADVPVTSVAFSRDSRLLLTDSLDHTAILWDVVTKVALLEINKMSGPLIGVTLSPDGDSILTRSLDGTIRLWSLTGRGPLRTLSLSE
jgi:hypothetical protein